MMESKDSPGGLDLCGARWRDDCDGTLIPESACMQSFSDIMITKISGTDLALFCALTMLAYKETSEIYVVVEISEIE